MAKYNGIRQTSQETVTLFTVDEYAAALKLAPQIVAGLRVFAGPKPRTFKEWDNTYLDWMSLPTN